MAQRLLGFGAPYLFMRFRRNSCQKKALTSDETTAMRKTIAHSPFAEIALGQSEFWRSLFEDYVMLSNRCPPTSLPRIPIGPVTRASWLL